jgi:Fe-S oxidoreductase
VDVVSEAFRLPGEAATFWFGCNVARHGELIRLSIELLRRVGIEPAPVGGLNYCCGSTKDANLTASEGMGRRTATRLSLKGSRQVVTWCPSCYMQLEDVISRGNVLEFDYQHIAETLHERRALLQPHLVNPVRRKAVLHKHSGFERRTPVNRLVPEILSLVPGYELVSTGAESPGHMCSGLAHVPQALADAASRSWSDAEAAGADEILTIFHTCHRDLVGLERRHPIRVTNFVHVLAESMGLPFEDDYKTWRNSVDPSAAVGEQRIRLVGREEFERSVLPELKRPNGIGPA